MRAADALRLCRDGSHSEAHRVWVEAGFDRLGRVDAPRVREFASRARLFSTPLRALSDGDLLLMLRQQLRLGQLVAIQASDDDLAGGESDTAAQRRLIRHIEKEARGRLNYAGRRYRLVADVDLSRVANRDTYEVVRHADAVRTLDELATQPGTTHPLAELLRQARARLTADWRQPLLPDGLVLLRQLPVAQARRPPEEGPLTPSQMRALLGKNDWIEIDVVDDEDEPYTGAYSIELTDTKVVTGNFDAEGFWGKHGIDSGTCTLTLTRLRGVTAAAAPQVAPVPAAAAAAEPEEEVAAADDAAPDAVDAADAVDAVDALAALPTVTFEATLRDELGKPVPGVALVFQHGDTSGGGATDGAGKASFTTTGTDGVDVGFASVADLAEAMRPIWSQCRGVARADWPAADAGTIDLALSGGQLCQVTPGQAPDEVSLAHFSSAPSAAGAPAHLRVQPLVSLARFLGKHFDLDKSFLLPTALASPQEIVRLHQAFGASTILIVGHTDTSADDEHNLELSVERAQAMQAYLTNDVDTWLAWYDSAVPDSKRWGSPEDSFMMGSLLAGTGFSITVRGYQRWHNSAAPQLERFAVLDEDGEIGPLTREQLILDYMHREDTTVPAGTPIEIHGCGEFFPLDATGAAIDANARDGERQARNRRVEVFFFPKELGVLPPSPGERASKGEQEYPEWRARAVTSEITAPDAAPVRFQVKLVDADFDASPYANRPYELRTEGQVFTGVTTAEGVVAESIPPSATTVQIVLQLDDGGSGPTVGAGAGAPATTQEWTLAVVTEMPPPDTVRGVLARLHNLGYYEKEAGDDFGDDERFSLRWFQVDNQLPDNGDVNDAGTQTKLVQQHGC